MTVAAHDAGGNEASSYNVAHLTRRELEVLACLSSGKTNREIAQALFIATGTVKNHLRSIYSKLGVSNRTEAAMVTLEVFPILQNLPA